jgi:predicted RNase H-related nuclease YkuK (DUF458 family)
MWLEPSGERDRTIEMFEDIKVQENKTYVGTDSHSYGKDWLFATVVCCHTPGRGGRFYTKRMRFPKEKFKTLVDRLLYEAYLSVEIAQEIEETTGRKAKVHVDVSSRDTMSSKFHSNVSSYVLGMGFEVSCKPESWASSCVADRQAR